MQFLAEADTAATANRPDAAMLCAIHAAISAADAVTIGLSQLRSTDPNHAAAADLLRSAARDAGRIVEWSATTLKDSAPR